MSWFVFSQEFLSKTSWFTGSLPVSLLPSVHISCNSINTDLWHQRLGHMSVSRMNLLPFINKTNFLHHFTVCPLSKQTRIVFPKASVSRALHYFALLNMDVWGPFRVPTYNGEHYFLTIVDDFSRGNLDLSHAFQVGYSSHYQEFFCLSPYTI